MLQGDCLSSGVTGSRREVKKRPGEAFQGKMRALGLGRRRELLMKLVGSCGGEHVRGYTTAHSTNVEKRTVQVVRGPPQAGRAE